MATLMAAIVALFVLTAPSRAQEPAPDSGNAFDKQTHAKIDLYLAKHPVRPSPLFEATTRLMALLGRLDAMIVDACEFDPDFPNWQDAAKGLRENTVLAFTRSYGDEMRKEMDETPASGTVRDRLLCADEKRHREKTVRELQRDFAALRRQGY